MSHLMWEAQLKSRGTRMHQRPRWSSLEYEDSRDDSPFKTLRADLLALVRESRERRS